MTNWSCSGLCYARFEEFIHNVETEMRIVYAWPFSPHNKLVPN